MLTKEHIEEFLDNHLHEFDYPQSYLGNEAGVISKKWEATYPHICVIGGGSYYQLAGNLAVGLITQLINEMTPALAHRAFFPSSHKEVDKFEKHGVPIFGLEEKRPITEYDLLAFSCSYPGTDFNVLKMLLLSGLPPYARDRRDSDPIILRGGATFSNVDNFVDMYDLVFIGEGEESIPKLVDYFVKYRRAMPKKQFICKVVAELPGFYSALFTREVYGGDKRIKGWEWWGITSEVVEQMKMCLTVRRVWVKDISKSYIYSNQIVNYVDPGMGAGNMLVSRGCHTRCTFCNEGYCNLPYRDLPADVAIPHLLSSMRTSGACEPLLSAFCSSSYAYKKQVIAKLLMGGSEQVGFISQRVDECAKDENFVALTALGGNKSVSLGVESSSDRGRRAVNKHCTEAQILQASEYFMKYDYKTIKYYMISNLPMDEQSDIDEVMNWIPKVIDIKKRLGAKTKLVISYTPLIICGHTPMQWYECRPDRRCLENVVPWAMKNPDVEIRLGKGKTRGNMCLSQLLFMADRRLFPVWIELVKDRGFEFFSNLNNADYEWLTKKLEGMGLPWSYWFRTKPKDEIFPWDWIDIGVSKEQLWLMKERADKYEESPKCSEKCESDTCKNCETIDLSKRKERLEVKDPDVDLSKLQPFKVDIKQRIRAKIFIHGRHRFIDNKILKFIWRRAFYLSGLPIDKTRVYLASDGVKTKNWVEGVDYIDCCLTEELQLKGSELVAILQPLISHFDIQEIRYYRPESITGFTTTVDRVYYELVISEPMDVISQSVDNWLAIEPVDIPKDLEGDARRDFIAGHKGVVRIMTQGYAGQESILVDARKSVYGAGVHPNTGRAWILMDTDLSPLLVAQRMFHLASQRLKMLRVIRVDYYSAPKRDLFSLFGAECEICGGTIESSLFGAQVHPTRCLKDSHASVYNV